MELIIVSIIVLFVVSYTRMVNFQELFSADGKAVSLLKEKDYDHCLLPDILPYSYHHTFVHDHLRRGV